MALPASLRKPTAASSSMTSAEEGSSVDGMVSPKVVQAYAIHCRLHMYAYSCCSDLVDTGTH